MGNIRIEKGWGEILEDQFESPYFQHLREFIRTEYASGIVYPPANLIFHAFDACPWDKTRVVLLGQDPYINPGQAHGLCFSVPEGITKPPSLLNVFKEIQSQTGKPVPKNGNLESWARQGVLLLNTVLTVRAGLSNSHQGKGWEQFTDEVIRRLATRKEGLVFLLWGASARQKAGSIDPSRHLVLESAHPSPMSVTRGFFGNQHFVRCNEYLVAQGGSPIIW
jgi:uracil-DNA glycosylase